MNQGAFTELEDQVPVVAVMFVLVDCIAPGLARHRVLEFCCDHRDTVDTQDQIQAVVVLLGILELAGYGKAVRRIQPPGLRVHPAGRGEIRCPEHFPIALEAVPQHVQAALVLGVERPAEVV